MWWARSDTTADLYLATQALVLRDARSTSDDVRHEECGDVGREAALVRMLSSLGQARRRSAQVRVWLGGGLCPGFLLQRPQGLQDPTEMHRLAAGLAPQICGLPAPCQVWLDALADASAVVAASTSTLDLLRRAATEAGVRLRGVAPWWSAAQRAMCESPELGKTLSAVELLVRDDESVTVLRSRARAWQQLRTWFPLRDDASAVALTRRLEVERELRTEGKEPDRDGVRLQVRLDWTRSTMSAGPRNGQAVALRCAFGEWARVEVIPP